MPRNLHSGSPGAPFLGDRRLSGGQREAESRAPADRERILRLHQNAQRLLVPVAVINPYAAHLTFPDDRLSARRDHGKYLGLIRAIAFARQHQRTVTDGAVTVTLDDLALANRLAHHALGQSLGDLSAPSRRLLQELREWTQTRAGKEGVEGHDVRFSQRELREQVGWRKSQLADHVRELVEAEYLVVHVTGPGRRTRYALDWNGEGLSGERFYRGLVDTTTLQDLNTSGAVPGQVRVTSGTRERRRKGLQSPVKRDSARNEGLSTEGSGR